MTRSAPSRPGCRLRKTYPFLVVFVIELCFALYLVAGQRGVVGHDAFQYFSLQYYFLSNAAASGRTAQWMPLLTHGTVSNWWYGVHAGILQSAMLAMGKLNAALNGVNFLPIFYAGILFDLTLFLLGVWLLGRRYFSSNRTILFVALAAVGSANWFTQPWYNLHLVFALPLILHFVHLLLDTGKWRYLFLAGNLYAIQSIGIPSYVLPVSALVVFTYTVFHVAFFWRTASAQLLTLARKARHSILPLTLVLFSLAVVYGMLTHGTEEIANYNLGRTLEGRSESVESFLTYGTNSNGRWIELLTRVSPMLDYTVYMGYLTLVFAVLAFTVRPSRHLRVVGGTTLVVLLVADATLLARVLYYVWPLMKFYRHLSLASPIARTMLCFVAGFGFEALLTRNADPEARANRRRYFIAMVSMAGIALVLAYYSSEPSLAAGALWRSVLGNLLTNRATFDLTYLHTELLKAALLAAGVSLLFALLLQGKRSPRWITAAMILFQAVDLYSYRSGLSTICTIPLTREQYSVNDLRAVPYSPRRVPIDYTTHPRARLVPQNYFYGSVYWTADTFMFTDPPANLGRTDHWLWSLDDFLRTFWGEKLRDLSSRPSFYQVFHEFRFPWHRPNALKLAGVTEDKIQIFKTAHMHDDDRMISTAMASPANRGDLLYLSSPRQKPKGDSPMIAGNDRVHRPYDVVRFDADDIVIRVRGATAGHWLYYADCWHPFWRATVNGKASAVYRANLAYKAVELQDGDNLVHFRFHSPFNTICFAILNWNALGWVLLVLWMLYRELLTRVEERIDDRDGLPPAKKGAGEPGTDVAGASGCENAHPHGV